MHKVYEQGGKGDAAIVHLHYFTSSGDWYITERDTSVAQHQAFGSADLGYGPELGYISIAELIANGAELDIHWTPRTLGEALSGYLQTHRHDDEDVAAYRLLILGWAKAQRV